MIVEQIDAFKSWLTAVLKPMCEADPAALAKYVLALIKKDKSEAELRKSMVEQLEVFLEGETENFVNLVFQTLSTKDYITTPVIPSANPPNPNVSIKPKEVKDTKVIVQPSELPNLNEVVNGNSSEKKEVKKDIKVRRNSENADKEDRPIRRRSRHRSLSRNRTKSRSRSWDRVKRSRSREKSRERNDREMHRLDRDKRDRERLERDRVRLWRNKSPTRRYDRRRSRSPRSPSPPRIRSRSRSPRHSHRNRYRPSRSRSRSLEKRERKDSKDFKNQSRSGTPTQESNHADSVDLALTGGQNVASVVVQPSNSKRRCRDFDEKGYCMRGEMCPFDHGVDPVVLEDSTLTRVLSYDPNGDVAGAIAAGTPLAGVPMPPGTAAPPRHPVDNPYNPQAPQMWSGGRFRGPRPMGAVRLPGINPFAPQPPAGMGLQRELIPVPVVMDNTKPPGVVPPGNYVPVPGAPYGHPGAAPPQAYGPGGIPIAHPGLEGATMHPGMYKKKFDFNRLGPRKNPGNCSLELKKVPTGMNTITHLNNHFSKFGKIVNIQVQYEGDAEAALITFSSHAEANCAYRSTEAVLNNRFIKLFWHDSDGNKQENVPPAQQNAIKDRITTNVPPNSNKVLNLLQPKAGEPDGDGKNEKDESKPELSKEETKAQATAAIKKNQDLLAAQAKMNKNKDEQRKEVLKIQSDLRKRKQELLDKQLSQQKILIEKMSKLPPGSQRDVIKETIKKTQEAIEGIKKDLETAALAAKSATAGLKKSKEETQKELLDMELDLIAKQQEGADTSELQKKLAELKAKAVLMSRPTRGRGRGRFTPIVSRHLLSKNNLVDNSLKLTGKIKTVNKVVNNASITPTSLPVVPVQAATTFPKHAVDHRPTRLLVSGYETEEQDAVLAHFQQFGEVVDYTIDTSLPSITLNYKTRKEAEAALLKGKHFQDRTLSITWQSGNAHRLQTQRSGGSSSRTVLLSESDEDHLIDQSFLEGDEELGPETEEALLQDDEDEDEEDRSWRR